MIVHDMIIYMIECRSVKSIAVGIMNMYKIIRCRKSLGPWTGALPIHHQHPPCVVLLPRSLAWRAASL